MPESKKPVSPRLARHSFRKFPWLKRTGPPSYVFESDFDELQITGNKKMAQPAENRSIGDAVELLKLDGFEALAEAVTALLDSTTCSMHGAPEILDDTIL